jgi:tetratricopeptide (TPR) repeat protein
MLGFAWLLHRQAQEALKTGRLEDAKGILAQPKAQGQRGHGELVSKLAHAFVERGERHLRQEDPEAAWRDLLEAEQLHADDKAARQLRVSLSRLGMAETRALLHAGELNRAEETIARLQNRGVRLPEFKVLEESVKDWQRARDKAGQGEFSAALEIVDRVRRRLFTSYRALEEFRADLEVRQQKFGVQLRQLLAAADAGRWREVVEIAEQVLAVAPEHAEARKLRGRAWKALEPVTVTAAYSSAPKKARDDDLVCDGLPGRFLLWIDGVGGYLVCLNNRITFGHAGADAHVDVPLVADVSRLHASLSRDAEGYVLEAVKPIQVNGQTLTRATLRPGDRVTIGASCQFQFHQPVPVSTTARLDLVSGHRLSLTVDGILLMADTLVMGDGPQVHVSIPDLKKNVVLFRHKDGIGLRQDGSLLVNGQKSGQRGVLGPNATVVGGDLSFTIEPVGLHLGTV